MTFSISKDFAFSASHRLDGLPDDHQCARLHGHNYLIRVSISSETLDSVGFVLDYGRLAPFAFWLDDTLDHRHLNDVLDVNPTAEHLAIYLVGVIRRTLDVPDDAVIAVGVSETPKTWAWWSE